MRIKRGKILIIVFVLAFITLIFVSGCQISQQKNKEEKSGIEINLIGGAGFIEDGKEIFEGEPFKVGIELVNYDDTRKEGNVCLWDNMNDYYGGIKEKECQSFVLQGKGTTKIVFPKIGNYAYANLPSSFSVSIGLEVNVLMQSNLIASLTYPQPQQESFSLTDGILSFNIAKSIHAKENGYELILEINPSKESSYKIKTGENENIISFSISAIPLALECETIKQKFSESALINISEEKTITCTADITTKMQDTVPLQIRASYLASQEQGINFYIKKK